MAKDQLVARLQRANPHLVASVSDEQLKAEILSSAPEWGSAARGLTTPRRPPRRWIASGAVAAVALAAALVLSLSGGATNVAQAFPILKSPSTITPSELRTSLLVYGVNPNTNDGLDLAHGRAISTRWGTGYVLSNPQKTTLCIVAPGPGSHGWGASCASRSRAIAAGTGLHVYAYDSASHSARAIALFPRGAVVTMTARGASRHRVRLHEGVLAINVSRPEQIAITIAHHTTVEHVAASDASPIYGTPAASGTSTTATAAMNTSTAP
jgi:hypothetical protein